MVTSFRMYNVVPRAVEAWRKLFTRVFAETELPIDVIDHGPPGPIATLWQAPDLCCAFMCGWPFARAEMPMQAIAAPVPSPPRYAGLPRYCSEFLVREDSGWHSLPETFGHRFGWMASNSQSGFNAPRAYLANFLTPQRRALYAEVRGPLGSPAQTLDALRGGDVDVIALDCYWLDLCRHHAPERLRGVRCVATTPWTPIPLLVAAPGVEASIVETLRQHLITLHTDEAYRPLLADVLLAKFVVPDPSAYRALESMAHDAAARDYVAIR